MPTAEPQPHRLDDEDSENSDNPRPRATSFEHIKVVSQNAYGAKEGEELNGVASNEKFESIVQYMHDTGTGIVLLQETWMVKTWRREINGITVLHHGPDKSDCNRGRGGLAIFLNKEATRAWKDAGEKTYQPGCIADTTTRIMGIQLVFQEKRKNQERRKQLWINLLNVYAPHSGMTDDIKHKYEDWMDRVCQTNPSKCRLIIGGDLNATIGNRNNTDGGLRNTLGPYGHDKTNDSGEQYLRLMQTYGLRAATTYFKHRNYATHIDNRTKRARQIDHFLTDVRLGKRIIDARRILTPLVASDHLAVELTIRLGVASKAKTKDPPTTTNWGRISGQETNQPDKKAYNNAVTQLNLATIAQKRDQEPLWNGDTLGVRDISKTLTEAGEAVLSEPRTTDPGWFVASAEKLLVRSLTFESRAFST